MIKAIFSDLDGVLRHWDNQELFAMEEELGLRKGIVFEYAFHESQALPAITGKVTQSVWEQNVIQALSDTLSSQLAEHLVAQWLKSPFTIDTELIEHYQNVFPEAQLFLVTNATSRLNADLNHTNIPKVFDQIFNSWEMGTAKPETSFYHHILKETGMHSHESIFIDDNYENIQKALDMNFHGIHYTNRTSVLNQLSELVSIKM